MDDDTLRALCDLNLLESIRFHGRISRAARIEEGGGVLLVAGATEFPVGFSNAATRVDSALAPAELLERADAFFGARGRSYTVWIRGDHDADLAAATREAGATELGSTPCMSVGGALGQKTPPPGVEVRVADTPDAIRGAQRVNREAYESIGMPPRETDALYERPEVWLGADKLVVVAYADGEPLATASLLMSPRVGGIYWVGTRAAARGRGLGELCTRVVTDAAFDRGAQVATLQASPMGEPIYLRLGYREIDRQRWLLRTPG